MGKYYMDLETGEVTFDHKEAVDLFRLNHKIGIFIEGEVHPRMIWQWNSLPMMKYWEPEN